MAHAQTVLSSWQVPKDIWLVEEIPANDSGKISRRDLAKRFGNHGNRRKLRLKFNQMIEVHHTVSTATAKCHAETIVTFRSTDSESVRRIEIKTQQQIGTSASMTTKE
jgi:hypothetical protein